ncbi:hypothetical protein T4A_58 [Trichinella pseudospiralis]|uniref:Uncharacterized protein n=1 Tax=Trichinella pseudospiralis TaxID=6337 RepID=A0A0V1E8K1_TRIPS|nr:hypothetical protein T4A_58 [Trichinella pseudospiralis]
MAPATVAGTFGPDDQSQSTVRRTHMAVISRVQFWFQSGRVVIYCGGCNDGPDENNKAFVDSPVVTESPLQHHSFSRLVIWSFCGGGSF